MNAPRFVGIRLRYGCHENEFHFFDVPRPVVILGPNGSGKTTLLEALVRALYGFNRRTAADRDLAASRVPWGGGSAEAEVELLAPDGSWFRIARSFDTEEISVVDQEGTQVLAGEAKPAGDNAMSRAYRADLAEWIGFSTFEPYRHTAWIGQGELVETDLQGRLLSLAEGSHRRVEAAFESLEKSCLELSCGPIAAGRSTRRKHQRLEVARARLKEIEIELADARRAEEERAPRLERLETLNRQIEGLEAEIRVLEGSLNPLAELRQLELQRQQADETSDRTQARLRELEEVEREAARADETWKTASAAGTYPEDFEARLRELELSWQGDTRVRRQIATLSGRAEEVPRRASDLIPGAALLAAGLGAWTARLTVVAAILLAAGVTLFVLGAWRRARAKRVSGREDRLRHELEAERDRLENRIEEILAGTGISGLRPESAEEHRKRFRRQSDVAARRQNALRDLETAVARLERVGVPARVGTAEAGGGSEAATATAGATLSERAEALREQLLDDVDAAMKGLAEAKVRLDKHKRAALALPEGVEPDSAAVQVALDRRRAKVAGLREERADLDQALRDVSRRAEKAPHLAEAREAQLRRVAELEEAVEAHRLAWSLIGDAYREFRERDQDRLLRAISERVEDLSSGVLGPVEAEVRLEDATVRLHDRTLPLSSPSLSFGQRHVLLLAIRLGTADYLAQEAVRHPLLIDEPFAHLDERNARAVWDLLTRVAAERQVIVATQSRLLLEELEAEPDITLEPPAG